MSKSRMFLLLLVVSAIITTTSAQNAPAPVLAQASAASADPSAAMLDLANKLEQEAQTTNLDLAKLRIEKWKADSQYKQQSQASADSISRNLTSALPALIAAMRSAPADLAPALKLYRDLVALNDAFKSLAESAGAFGPKQDFEAISQHAGALDGYRATLADSLESLAAQRDAELSQLRSAQRQASSASRPLPKKIIVDDDVPVKKKSSKSKAAPKKPQGA